MTFADVLRDTMTKRSVSAADIRRGTGVNETTLSHWLAGTRTPTLASADRVADYLDAPTLAIVAARNLKRRCIRCRRVYYADARHVNGTVYCDKACRMAAHRARQRRVEPAARKIRTAGMARAIATFCRGCEPTGICRTADCPLRAYSPFPLVTA